MKKYSTSMALCNYYKKRKIVSIDQLPSKHGDGVYCTRIKITFSDECSFILKTYLGQIKQVYYGYLTYVTPRYSKTFEVAEFPIELINRVNSFWCK